MIRFGAVVLSLLTLTCSSVGVVSALTSQRMVELIKEKDQNPRGGGHHVQFNHMSQALELIYDVHANRMRLIAPIPGVSSESLTQDDMKVLLEANFHTSLDVRYATAGGVVFAAYLHPLDTLTENQFVNAMDQVANAATTYGSSYSSGSWTFVGSASATTTTTNSIRNSDATTGTTSTTNQQL